MKKAKAKTEFLVTATFLALLRGCLFHVCSSILLILVEAGFEPMRRRSTAIAVALSLLAIGSPLVSANANPLATQYFDQGVEKFDAGNYQGAVDDYTKAIEINPQDETAYLTRGVAKRNLNDRQGAIADFTMAIEINPRFVLAYFNRGEDRFVLGDLRGAMTDFDNAIEIDPQFEDAYYYRASAKTRLGDHQGAIADWTKVIETYPQSGLDGLAYRNRGVDKAWIEDHEGACVDWKEAASLGDEDAAGWVKEFC